MAFYDVVFFKPPEVTVRLLPDGTYNVIKPTGYTIQALNARPPADQSGTVAALQAQVAQLTADLAACEAGEEPPPPPPPPPVVVSTGWQLWDGVSGTTGTHFNVGAALPWRNKGGDWLDADGVPQGPKAFATLKPTAAGVIAIDVTAIKSGDMFLVGSGSGVAICRREHVDPVKRPVLVVTMADGSTRMVPCVASGATNLTTFKGVIGQTTTVGTDINLALQFVIPAGAVKAVLQLTAEKVYAGTVSVRVFELHQPRAFNIAAATTGLAEQYPLDAGIDADPDVYFASSLTDPTQRAVVFADNVFLQNAAVTIEHGVPVLNVHYQIGSFSPMIFNHRWSQKRGVTQTRGASGLVMYEEGPAADYQTAQHKDTPRELYMRYYIKLKAGYQCEIEGKKLPGLAGRYGKWNTAGYYQPTAGNGGSPTTGLYTTTGGYSGWSMRCLAGVGANIPGAAGAPNLPDPGNPYAEHVAPLTYAYHAMMVGPTGDGWRWGDDVNGYPLLAPDQWNCIEQHVVMNTVNGPFDQYGNGTAVANGILEQWVEGVRVFRKTDVIYRKNLAIGIDEVWLDHYHGGTIPPEEDHGFAMAALVVARKYIGPMRRVMGTVSLLGLSSALISSAVAELPSWAAAPGELKNISAFINTSFDSIVPATYDVSTSRKSITDFASRVVNPAFGTHGATHFCGPGHAASNINWSFALIPGANGLDYRLLKAPHDFGLSASQNAISNQGVNTDQDKGTYNAAGIEPGSMHSYDSLAIRLPQHGGAAHGTLVSTIRMAVGFESSPNAARCAHAIAFTNTLGPFSATQISNSFEADEAGDIGSSVAYDPTRHRYWRTNAANATNGKIGYFDELTGEYGSVTYTGPARPTSAGAVDGGSMNYDSVHDVLIHSASSNTGVVTICYMSCANPENGWTTATLSTPIPGHTSGAAVPFGYVEALGKWFFASRQTRTLVYEGTIPATISNTWNVEAVAIGATLPDWYVVGKQWTPLPAIKGFLIIADHATVYHYRPRGWL